MEAEGKKLFAEAARKATGRHARRTFEFLEAEEELHAKVLSSCLKFAEDLTAWFLKRDRESS